MKIKIKFDYWEYANYSCRAIAYDANDNLFAVGVGKNFQEAREDVIVKIKRKLELKKAVPEPEEIEI